MEDNTTPNATAAGPTGETTQTANEAEQPAAANSGSETVEEVAQPANETVLAAEPTGETTQPANEAEQPAAPTDKEEAQEGSTRAEPEPAPVSLHSPTDDAPRSDASNHDKIANASPGGIPGQGNTSENPGSYPAKPLSLEHLEALIAEAEQRGYLRGRNEQIETLMRAPAMLEDLARTGARVNPPAASSEVLILNNPRTSVWDL